MGEAPKKYHITDDGEIYKVNDDGSFTSMGNAEQRNTTIRPEPIAGQRCEVILESAGTQKLLVVKTITELTDYSLKPAKALVDYLPAVIIDNISEAKALQIKSEFEKIGAVASIQPHHINSNRHTVIGDDAYNRHHSASGKGGGCFGIILLFLISTATIISTLI